VEILNATFLKKQTSKINILQKACQVCIQVNGKVIRVFDPEELKKVQDGFGFKRLWKSGELACGSNMARVMIVKKHVTCEYLTMNLI
jgi:hypothetical protein